MPRHLLTAKEIIAARNCDMVDGDGLIVRVSGPSAAAALRFTSPVTGNRREMGLGKLRRDSFAAAGESLAAVRNAAEEARRFLARNLDPIDERDRQAEANCGDRSGDAATSAGRVTLRRYRGASRFPLVFLGSNVKWETSARQGARPPRGR